MTNPCVIYYRTACTPYAVRDESLERQEDICRKYALEHGLDVVESFYDRGVAGNTKDRKGFNSLLNYLKKRNGKPVSVVIPNLSRIGRSMDVAACLLDKVSAFGAKVLFAEEAAGIQ